MLLIVSSKHERQCTQCHRWFWAHDTARTVCRQCLPDSAEEARKELRKIHAGASHEHVRL
jgi:uncharacterized Zn ribbon protein